MNPTQSGEVQGTKLEVPGTWTVVQQHWNVVWSEMFAHI